MHRRDFLRLLGLGTAAAAMPVIAEPFVRKLWSVPSNAPVGSRVERVQGFTGEEFGVDITAETWAPSKWELLDTGRLEPLPLTLVPAPSGYAEALRLENERMLRVSGLNSVARGDAPMTQADRLQLAEDMRRAGLLHSPLRVTIDGAELGWDVRDDDAYDQMLRNRAAADARYFGGFSDHVRPVYQELPPPTEDEVMDFCRRLGSSDERTRALLRASAEGRDIFSDHLGRGESVRGEPG